VLQAIHRAAITGIAVVCGRRFNTADHAGRVHGLPLEALPSQILPSQIRFTKVNLTRICEDAEKNVVEANFFWVGPKKVGVLFCVRNAGRSGLYKIRPPGEGDFFWVDPKKVPFLAPQKSQKSPPWGRTKRRISNPVFFWGCWTPIPRCAMIRRLVFLWTEDLLWRHRSDRRWR